MKPQKQDVSLQADDALTTEKLSGTVLQVNDDATASEIKFAYRNLAKECHPDYLGNEGHNICILLNEGYETLSDPMRRSVYNEQLQAALIEAMDDYTGQPLSKWMAGHKMGKSSSESETRAVFVVSCCNQSLAGTPPMYTWNTLGCKG